MKNICFLIGNLDHSGGTERVTSLIANELAKQHQIFILSLAGGKKPFFDLHQSIKTFSLYPKKISMKSKFFHIVYKIRQFVKKNKIHTLIVADSISCVFTCLAVIGLGINHICWEHFNFNVNLGVPYRDWGRRLAAKYCNTIITLTERDMELWQQGLNNICARMVCIANPLSYENIEHEPDFSLKTVLAVGRLTHQKGFDLLIEAWAKVCVENTDWQLKIVGNGEDENSLKAQAEKLAVADRIDFIPATQNIEYFYRNASIFCLSSRYEGFGMVILEAMSFGLPVVSFDCDAGPADIIFHGKNGFLVAKENIEELANTLMKIMTFSENAYLEASAVSKQISQKFGMEQIISKWYVIV